MRRFRASFLLIAAIGVLGLAGCGGSDSNSGDSADQQADLEQIASVGKELQVAFSKRDATGFCALFDPQVIEEQLGSQSGCEKQAKASFRQNDGKASFAFADITLDGDYAVAKGSSLGDIYFRKIGGEWLVSREQQVSDEAVDTDPATDEEAIRERSGQVAAAVTAGNPDGFCEQFNPVAMMKRFKSLERCAREFRPSIVRAAAAIKRQGKPVTVDRVEMPGENRAIARLSDGAGQIELVQVEDAWFMALPRTGPGS